MVIIIGHLVVVYEIQIIYVVENDYWYMHLIQKLVDIGKKIEIIFVVLRILLKLQKLLL